MKIYKGFLIIIVLTGFIVSNGCTSNSSVYDEIDHTMWGHLKEIKYQNGAGEKYSITDKVLIEDLSNILKLIKIEVAKEYEPMAGSSSFTIITDDEPISISFEGKYVSINRTHYLYKMNKDTSNNLNKFITSLSPNTIYPMSTEQNLKNIEYPNLNEVDNPKVKIAIPDDWSVSKATWAKSDRLVFNDDKNKSIKELYEYTLFDSERKVIGTFGLIGRYNNEDFFPNHMQLKTLRYEGKTSFGVGKIYLLKLDLPKEQVTNEKDYFLEYYSLIPIMNENLSYCFSLKIPEGENRDVFLSKMKSMLLAEFNTEEEIYKLFQESNTNSDYLKKIINILPTINWNLFFKSYGDTGFQLMDGLASTNVDKNELVKILSSTYGLDGMYADSYSRIVTMHLKKDTKLFIQAISLIEPAMVKEISSYAAYDMNPNEKDSMSSELKKLKIEGRFLEREKIMIDYLAEALTRNK